MVPFWLLLGWDLSYHKGQHGAEVDWIGYHIRITPTEVVAKITEDSMT